MMKTVSSFKLAGAKRSGGGGQTERSFFDFIIDGRSLREELKTTNISCLGWFIPEQNAKAVQRLMLIGPADLPDERRSLYVCPECGDLGCGSISVVIEQVVHRTIAIDADERGRLAGADEVVPSVEVEVGGGGEHRVVGDAERRRREVAAGLLQSEQALTLRVVLDAGLVRRRSEQLALIHRRARGLGTRLEVGR